MVKMPPYLFSMKKITKIILILLVWLVCVGFYQTTKKLPENLNFRGKKRAIAVENIEFLYDLTYRNDNGDIISEQTIFNEIFSLIDGAQVFIIIDAFLFNAYTREPDKVYRHLTSELAERLAKKKEANPSIQIDFITDPINTVYGGSTNSEIERLKGAGVNVIVTDLKALPDSNPIYSAFWRTFIQWFGNSEQNGLLPHPFTGGEPKVTLRSYLDMLNFKANHRKVFMADRKDHAVVILTSGNPHDGSSAHSNVALKISGNIWQDVYAAEAAIAKLSDRKLQEPLQEIDKEIRREAEHAKIVFLTENQIKKELLARIRQTIANDEIRMALFYLSDRQIIKALVDASERGVHIKVILDPNKDAFGFEKIGVPNQPVAEELLNRSSSKIQVRWYDTHGEQFHTKLALIKHGTQATLLLGSANFTRRNLDNYNLEANVAVTAGEEALFIKAVEDYLDRIWDNRDGKTYTVGYESYKDASALKKLIYFIQEYAGLSSF
ncbi:MAG: phospholipase D-like domain-containing protein [Desulfobacterales bacterium]|jgi:phosphatidylserine/phosphatidylglycerophosphate/cardiolipin synthase-like enzyme